MWNPCLLKPVVGSWCALWWSTFFNGCTCPDEQTKGLTPGEYFSLELRRRIYNLGAAFYCQGPGNSQVKGAPIISYGKIALHVHIEALHMFFQEHTPYVCHLVPVLIRLARREASK